MVWGKINKIGLVGLVAGFAMILNISTLKSPIWGLILSVFWLGWLVLQLARGKYGLGWPQALAVVFSVIIILGAIFFYIFNLGTVAIMAIIIILTILGCLVGKNSQQTAGKINWKFHANVQQLPSLILYFILYILSFVLLLTHQTAEPIRTPWEVLPKIFLVLYFILSCLLLAFVLGRKKETEETSYPLAKIILISLHYFLTLSVALIVYKIGFGFDPFVHRAAETALAQLGYISPKPLYYIGQYSLVVLLARFFHAAISLVDKLLVPVLAALILPGLIYGELKKILSNKKILLAGLVLLLLITTPLFFYTVPQSLANLLLLILIFGSWPLIIQRKKIAAWQWLILGAIFFIHPLSAMPGLIWLVWWSLAAVSQDKLLKSLLLVLSILVMPLLFILMAKVSAGFGISFAWQNLFSFGQTLGKNIFNYLPFYSIYHLIYLYSFNSLLLFLIFFGLGIFYFIKKQKQAGFIANYLLLLGALLVSLVLVGLIGFTAVIGYEQTEFAERLLQVIALLALPIVVFGFYSTLEKILTLKMGRLMVIFLGGLALTFSLYLSYPHNDALEKGRSYAVSKYDLEAVRWIDADGAGRDFVVLANQSVSAASLQEFGFKKYYIIFSSALPPTPSSSEEGRELFYYPIPTSSPLYEIYLDIIYNGVTREKIEKARALTGAAKVYLVINSYWLDAKKRIGEAQMLTGEYEEIEGKVWVFGFGEVE